MVAVPYRAISAKSSAAMEAWALSASMRTASLSELGVAIDAARDPGVVFTVGRQIGKPTDFRPHGRAFARQGCHDNERLVARAPSFRLSKTAEA